MLDEKGKPDENVRPDGGQHEEFLELCAISTTESLSEEDQKKLREHLASCAACRKVLKGLRGRCRSRRSRIGFRTGSRIDERTPEGKIRPFRKRMRNGHSSGDYEGEGKVGGAS